MAEELNFYSGQGLSKWLEDKPPAWTQVITLRCALRVFPLVATILDVPDNVVPDERKRELVLQSWRAVLLSSVARKSPSDYVRSVTAAASAATEEAASAAAAAISPSIDTAYAAASAAFAASSGTYNAIRSASFVATYAATAAANVAQANSSDIWATISYDCRWIQRRAEADGRTVEAGLDIAENEQDSAVIDLMRRPLWAGLSPQRRGRADMPPSWAESAYQRFLMSRFGHSENWGLIQRWYAATIVNLEGGIPRNILGREGERKIALQPVEFWNATAGRSADQIIDEIAEMRGWRPTVAEQSSRETMREFIIRNLEEAGDPLSIDDFVGRFGNAGYRSSRQSIRGRLNELTDRKEILRVGRGMYASLDRRL